MPSEQERTITADTAIESENASPITDVTYRTLLNERRVITDSEVALGRGGGGTPNRANGHPCLWPPHSEPIYYRPCLDQRQVRLLAQAGCRSCVPHGNKAGRPAIWAMASPAENDFLGRSAR